MKKQLTSWLVLAGFLAFGLHATTPPVQTAGSRIQMAILLDTSGSMDGLIDQAALAHLEDRQRAGRGQEGRPGAAPAGGAVRIRPEQHSRRLRLPAPHRALERRPRPRIRGIVQAADQRRRGILRPVIRQRGPRAGMERAPRRPEADLHRRQRAVHARDDRLPRLLPGSHRPRHRRQHHFLRQLPGRAADRMEGRRRPGRRPVRGHRRRPTPRRRSAPRRTTRSPAWAGN